MATTEHEQLTFDNEPAWRGCTAYNYPMGRCHPCRKRATVRLHCVGTSPGRYEKTILERCDYHADIAEQKLSKHTTLKIYRQPIR